MAKRKLTFSMLTPDEMERYIKYANSWGNRSLWSDAKRAAESEKKSTDFLRAVATGGMSMFFNQGKSLFYSQRGKGGIDQECFKFMLDLKSKYNCDTVDFSSFPNFPKDLREGLTDAEDFAEKYMRNLPMSVEHDFRDGQCRVCGCSEEGAEAFKWKCVK